MASITCRAGDAGPHTHSSVAEVRNHYGRASTAAPLAEPAWKINKRQALDTVLNAPAQPEVPAGRYALRTDDTVRFYRVDRPTKGQWAHYTFVTRQAGDDEWPVRNAVERQSLLGRIGQDVAAASKLYGTEIGACGVCGRTLTDETSRAAGIGPVCAVKTGW